MNTTTSRSAAHEPSTALPRPTGDHDVRALKRHHRLITERHARVRERGHDLERGEPVFRDVPELGAEDVFVVLRGDVGPDDDECEELPAEVVLSGGVREGEGGSVVRGGLTERTIQNKILSARYSTPPSSSCSSFVKSWK